MLLKDYYGDWGICLGLWEGYKRGIPGKPGEYISSLQFNVIIHSKVSGRGSRNSAELGQKSEILKAAFGVLDLDLDLCFYKNESKVLAPFGSGVTSINFFVTEENLKIIVLNENQESIIGEVFCDSKDLLL